MLHSESHSSTTSKVRFSEVLAPKFHPVHIAIKKNTHTTFWLKGGRGSTKSSFVAIQIIRGLVDDPEANALVTRKVGDTIRQSVLETLLWAIDKLQLSNYFEFTRSPAEITYIPTGQKIIMKGLDDPLKLKSIKIKKGYFKFLWFEEGSEYSGPEEIRNVEQSVLRGGDTFVEFITYNPPNDPAAWVNKIADKHIKRQKQGIGDTYVHESTYLDVPADWLGKTFIDKALELKKDDRVAYDHEYLGLAVGRAEQIVFHGKWMEKEFDTPQGVRFHYGADWGFANDPTALIRSFVKDDCLYVDYEAVGYGVEIDETPALFKQVPGADKWPIKADSSRPETISYVMRRGFNVTPAEKWSGSVEDGIAHLKGFKKIYVHPRCKHLIKELSLYSYKVDKVTKEILPILVDKYNHCIDALRYALDGYIQQRGGLGVWRKLNR